MEVIQSDFRFIHLICPHAGVELTHIIFSRKRNKMSTLWWKKVDLWTHFTFNIKDNFSLVYYQKVAVAKPTKS